MKFQDQKTNDNYSHLLKGVQGSQPYPFAILAAVHRLRFPHFLYSLYKAPDQRSRALCNYFLIILADKGNKDHDLENQFLSAYPFRFLLLVPRLIADTLSALF